MNSLIQKIRNKCGISPQYWPHYPASIRNLTNEEADIYESWLNAEAIDTGISLFEKGAPMKKAYIYLDDIRPFPTHIKEEFLHCAPKSVNAAIRDIELCERNEYKNFILDLDHDLGDYYCDGGDGYKLVEWLIETGRNNSHYEVYCHSANPVGAEHIMGLVDKYWED